MVMIMIIMITHTTTTTTTTTTTYVYIYIYIYRSRAPHLSCDIHTHTPARTSYTNILLYEFVVQHGSTKCMGMGMNVTAQHPRLI